MEKKIKILKCVFHGIETVRFPLPLKGDSLDHEIMIETTQPTSCSGPINMSYHLFFERCKATGSLSTIHDMQKSVACVAGKRAVRNRP
jgi:hypothetical protein